MLRVHWRSVWRKHVFVPEKACFAKELEKELGYASRDTKAQALRDHHGRFGLRQTHYNYTTAHGVCQGASLRLCSCRAPIAGYVNAPDDSFAP